jgi:hypothetical protein
MIYLSEFYMPMSVFIAAAIGFFIGLSTNFGMAMFTSLFFALVMWAITGFKFSKGEINKNEATLELSVRYTSKISAHDIGVGLAVILDTSCSERSISKEERDLLQKIGLSIAQYNQEIIALCAAAQECAVANSNLSIELKEKILCGYQEAWENVKNASAKGSAAYHLFHKRRGSYLAAFEEDGERQMGTIASRISFTFSDALTEYIFDSSKNGFAFMLSAIRADSSFYAHVDEGKKALETQHIY